MKLLLALLVIFVNIYIIIPDTPPKVGKRYILETSKKSFRASRSPSLTSNSAHEVSPDNRVFGGIDASDGQFPYVAYHFVKTWILWFHCTAGIISPNWVLTTAYCIAKTSSNPNEHIVAAGKADMNMWLKARERDFMDPIEITDLGVQERRVEALFYHPAYRTNLTILDRSHDIGLMKLKRSFDFDNRVHSMPLSRTVFNGSTGCVITGYGVLKNNFEWRMLQYVSGVSVLPSKLCKNKEFDRLCMDQKNYGICGGDGGGPLVCGVSVTGVTASAVTASADKKVIRVESLSTIRGTESTTANRSLCGSEVYETYFTDVQKNLDWIDKILAEN